MVLRNGFLVQIILPDDVLLKKKKLYIFPPSLLCALVSASSVLGLVMSRKLPFQLYRVFFFSPPPFEFIIIVSGRVPASSATTAKR